MDFIEVIAPILPMCGLLILILLIGVVINYLWLKVMYRRIRACPSCGAKAAGQVTSTEELVLSNHVDYRGRKPVRIKESRITDQFQCEVCQFTWRRSFTIKERFPIDRHPRRG